MNPGAVMATLPGPGHVKVAIDAAKADANAPDTIRFDFTGQGKFSDAFSTPLKVVQQPGYPKDMFHGVFGPATFDFKNGDKVVKVTVAGNYTKVAEAIMISSGFLGIGRRFIDIRDLAVVMTCAAEGSCDFGGKSYKV